MRWLFVKIAALEKKTWLQTSKQPLEIESHIKQIQNWICWVILAELSDEPPRNWKEGQL